MKLSFSRFFCAVASLFIFASAAQAAPITFIYTGEGRGSLDGVQFGSSTFTIVATGLTEQREVAFSPGFFIDHLTAEITIQGLGTFEFITPTRTFSTTATGLARAGVLGADLYYAPGAFGSGWDMLTSFGPVSGSNGILQQWGIVPEIVTSGGILFFAGVTSVDGSFQAIVGDVSETPIPGALPLFATGLGALGLIVHRRMRKARA